MALLYDSCCWCLPLRTGCILIAILDLILQVLATIAALEYQMPYLYVVIISGNLIAFTITGLLVYGTIVQKRSFLWLWTVVNAVVVILLCILTVMCAIGFTDTAADTPGQADGKLASIIIGVLSAALATAQFVFTLIVYSYICKLRELEDSRAERSVEEN